MRVTNSITESKCLFATDSNSVEYNTECRDRDLISSYNCRKPMNRDINLCLSVCLFVWSSNTWVRLSYCGFKACVACMYVASKLYGYYSVATQQAITHVAASVALMGILLRTGLFLLLLLVLPLLLFLFLLL